MQRERALSERLMVVASLREGVLAAPGGDWVVSAARGMQPAVSCPGLANAIMYLWAALRRTLGRGPRTQVPLAIHVSAQGIACGKSRSLPQVQPRSLRLSLPHLQRVVHPTLSVLAPI